MTENQYCIAHVERLNVKVRASRLGLCYDCFRGKPLGSLCETIEFEERRKEREQERREKHRRDLEAIEEVLAFLNSRKKTGHQNGTK